LPSGATGAFGLWRLRGSAEPFDQAHAELLNVRRHLGKFVLADKVFGFADGENLVLRFQDMCKDGHKPKSDVVHVPDTVVWHPDVTQQFCCDIVRMSYYQTVVGDEPKLNDVRAQLQDVQYMYILEQPLHENDAGSSGQGYLAPRVFKKEGKSSRTKSVDINLTVDMLRSAYNPNADIVFLLSGDGDYLPLVEEVARRGKNVWLAAFSKGLRPALRFAADAFIDLDKLFFESTTDGA
jgi:uncharacterized LabA/DUF88 family protein